jgi:hypothetical protein
VEQNRIKKSSKHPIRSKQQLSGCMACSSALKMMAQILFETSVNFCRIIRHNRMNLNIGYTSDTYFGGVLYSSLCWNTSISPVKCLDSVSIMRLHLASEFFAMDYSSIILPLHAVRADIAQSVQ